MGLGGRGRAALQHRAPIQPVECSPSSQVSPALLPRPALITADNKCKHKSQLAPNRLFGVAKTAAVTA